MRLVISADRILRQIWYYYQVEIAVNQDQNDQLGQERLQLHVSECNHCYVEYDEGNVPRQSHDKVGADLAPLEIMTARADAHAGTDSQKHWCDQIRQRFTHFPFFHLLHQDAEGRSDYKKRI